MKMFIEELHSAFLDVKKSACCVVVEAKGSTPRSVGAKMIVYDDGSIRGTIGGGRLEKKVISDALEQIKKGEPALFAHDLLKQHDMCCGGSVKIYIEPIMKTKRLYIFGAGHTGEALATFASKLDFSVTLIDDRSEYLDPINIEGVSKVQSAFMDALKALQFDHDTYIAIMTYRHEIDRDILAYCVNKPHAYLGMIGSRRKVAVTKKLFSEMEVAPRKVIEKVDMPMGLDIGADGPGEIAVAVLAKLIQAKNE